MTKKKYFLGTTCKSFQKLKKITRAIERYNEPN